MKILVFGAGAMGTVFGGFLSKENEVALIGRKAHVKVINTEGVRISGIWGEHRFSSIKAFESLKDMPKEGLFDLVIITTKSFDTYSAVKKIASFTENGAAVMSMQNGIGNEDTISSEVGRRNTMGGMAIFGARLLEPGHVEVTVYASECLVGDLDGGATERAKRIAETFSSVGIPAKPSENIIRDKWMKAFYNIALNPLSAILKVPYGELEKTEETKHLMKALLKEAFEVAKASAIPLEFTWNEYFKHLLERQLPPTASHRSSMLQDIERGRKTEIDYLNGAIVDMGKKTGVKTPVNETITGIIKALEKRS